MPLKKPFSVLPRMHEAAVYLLIVGTLSLVWVTDGLPLPTLALCLLVAALRIGGITLSTNAGCAVLIAVAAGTPLYWFYLRSFAALDLKDFLLAVLMVFLLSAQTGRDFAAVSSYCVWIMLAALFPTSGPQQWMLLGALFVWFLVVQSLNELRRSRESQTNWKGLDGWRLMRPLAGFALVMVLGVALFSAGLYVLLPRSPIAAFQFNFKPFRRLVGFSNSVRLGVIGQMQDDQTPAFRVRFLQGAPPAAIRWRGVGLADFNGSAWTNTTEAWNESSQQGRITIASDAQRRKAGERLYYEVQTLADMDRVLFSVGVPEFVYLPEGRLRINGEGTLRQISLREALPTYSLSGLLDRDYHTLSSDMSVGLGPEMRQRYLKLPFVHPRIRELAQTAAGQSREPFESAQRIEAYLRRNYSYSLDSKIGSREPLLDFLFVERSGHCEYFASAMAVMLRSLKIPTRVVTGFYGMLPEPIGPWYVIRSSNAHSWVEVWIEGRGWVVFDPTPPGSNQPRMSALRLWFLKMQDRLVVMSEEWMGGGSGLLRPTLPKLDVNWGWLTAVLLLGSTLLGAVVFWWHRKPVEQTTQNEATLAYRRYLEAAKKQRALSQTARELEQSEIVRLYERARFARDQGALVDLKRLVTEFVEKSV